MKVMPGDIVTTRDGWSISKLNPLRVSARALGAQIGDNLLVLAVTKEEDEAALGALCVLSPSLGPLWVINDERRVSVVR